MVAGAPAPLVFGNDETATIDIPPPEPMFRLPDLTQQKRVHGTYCFLCFAELWKVDPKEAEQMTTVTAFTEHLVDVIDRWRRSQPLDNHVTMMVQTIGEMYQEQVVARFERIPPWPPESIAYHITQVGSAPRAYYSLVQQAERIEQAAKCLGEQAIVRHTGRTKADDDGDNNLNDAASGSRDVVSVNPKIVTAWLAAEKQLREAWMCTKAFEPDGAGRRHGKGSGMGPS